MTKLAAIFTTTLFAALSLLTCSAAGQLLHAPDGSPISDNIDVMESTPSDAPDLARGPRLVQLPPLDEPETKPTREEDTTTDHPDQAPSDIDSPDRTPEASRKLQTLPPDSEQILVPGPGLTPIVSPAVVWWESAVAAPLRRSPNAIPVDVPKLMSLAAAYSARVQAVRQTPWVLGTQVDVEKAAFDPSLFAETQFDDTSDPVDSGLDTGGPPRLNQHDWTARTGIRRRTLSGASVELAQRLGHLNSNSTFILPNNQGSARLTLGVTQPLLRGRGVDYNTSLLVAAQMESDAGHAEYLRTLQDQLLQVATTYWSLYVQRATLLQRQRHLQRALDIAEQLEQRRGLDSVESQVMRARAAVATRRAELTLADAQIKNLESEIRALINAPGVSDQPLAELVPQQPPTISSIDFNLCDEVGLALRRRPEVAEIMSQARAAAVRMQAAEHELLPQLNLILEGYVAGLDGNSDVGDAWAFQFSQGAPSYTAGLQFDVPLGNRAAAASLHRRRFELARLEHTLRETLANVQTEVETAYRNVEAARHMAAGRMAALEAVTAELHYLEDRWRQLRGDPQLGQLQLDDLLNAQDRLLQEQQALVAALADYSTSLLELQRATGALVVPMVAPQR